MIFYSKAILSLCLLSVTVNSCMNNRSNVLKIPPKECIELNNQGVNDLMKFPDDGKDDVNKAIGLFKQAINCDSSYGIAYMNLANAYDRKNDYIDEIMTYDKALILFHGSPAIVLQKGMAFEKMNSMDSAKRNYYLAKAGYERSLAKHPDKITLINGFVETKAVIYGRDSAINELNKQIKLHPDLSSKLSEQYYFYKDSDRRSYVIRSN